jgi:hypothetical protein
MKKPLLGVAAALAQTVLVLGLLLWVRPLAAVNALIDRAFRVPGKASKLVPTRRNPDLHETSFGDNPLASFRHLAATWAKHPGAKRVVFAGNSQLQFVTLADDEPWTDQPEPTAVDWVAEQYAASGRPVVCYRLSAGALSYTEALWSLLYLVNHPEVKPDAFVLQANYQGFWNSGLRSGMLTLLDDPAFAAAAAHLAQPGSSLFAEAFEQAIQKHAAEQDRRTKGPGPAAAGTTLPAGHHLETRVREALDANFPLFRQRGEHKVDLLNTLYRGRIYLLGLRASSARSISGPRLDRSRASLEAIAAVCRANGVRMMIYDAPLNPRVSLFKTAADRSGYVDYLARFSRERQVPLFDLSAIVPERFWGRLLDGPEPLHLSRAGHKQLASVLFEKLGEQGF